MYWWEEQKTLMLWSIISNQASLKHPQISYLKDPSQHIPSIEYSKGVHIGHTINSNCSSSAPPFNADT